MRSLQLQTVASLSESPTVTNFDPANFSGLAQSRPEGSEHVTSPMSANGATSPSNTRSIGPNKSGSSAASTTTSESAPPSSVISFAAMRKKPREREAVFIGLEEWEGVVLSIGADCFVARLVNRTHPDQPDEEAEFPLDLVSEDDRSLLRPGAVLRWTAGVTKLPGGGKQSTSQIVFRRLPQWTARELAEADEIAARLAAAFNQDEPRGAGSDERSSAERA